MIGYKAFNSDLTCIDCQYEIGKIYKMDDEPVCCENGFHFCKDLEECFYYYSFDSRVCIVEALGDLDSEDNEKFCTNKIKIIRELSFEEICSIIRIETILGKNLIKSFELTKEFFRNKALLGGGWIHGLRTRSFYWIVIISSGNRSRYIGARLSKDFKKIEFFNWNNSDKILFECDDKEIYQVSELEEANLEWFEYLKDNLEFII